ncbi:MAG: endonuclease/exonuclease/phosphatase family protein [Verrucomicrobiota bacterium]
MHCIWRGLLALCIVGISAIPCSAEVREFTVMAYNVENLFDIDRVSAFEDYRENPTDSEGYGPGKLLRKLEAIRRVLGSVHGGTGPDILLLNELEVDATPETTVSDLGRFLEAHRGETVAEILTGRLTEFWRGLPAEVWLLKHLEDTGLRGYAMAVDTVNARAGMVALMTQKNVVLSRFPISFVQTHPTQGARGILEVVVRVGGRDLYLLVNHWKSGASDPQSETIRRGNAEVARRRLDQILAANPRAEVILGGDFNSHYNQRQRYPRLETTALQDVLGSQGDKAAMGKPGGPVLYNLWYEIPVDQRGSDVFSGDWGTLMHLMLTRGLLDGVGIEYIDEGFRPVRIEGVTSQPPLGLPWRWSGYGPGAGTSDHFPLLARFRFGVADGTRVLRQDPALAVTPSTAAPVGYDRIDRTRLRNARVLSTATPATLARSMGELFVVEGRIARGRSAEVEVAGRSFQLHSFDSVLQRALRRIPRGSAVRLVGELGAYRGRLQFLIHDRSWLE